MASKSCELLLSTINDILDQALILNGKLNINNQRCNIKQLVQEVLDLFKFQAENKAISLSFNYQLHETCIVTDGIRLK